MTRRSSNKQRNRRRKDEDRADTFVPTAYQCVQCKDILDEGEDHFSCTLCGCNHCNGNSSYNSSRDLSSYIQICLLLHIYTN
jgi:hypothetical protein